MKTILCYGDSNTWGYVPGKGTRFPKDVRWTGVLQNILGDEYEVIEAGLCGRTTIWDDPFNEFANGEKTLLPILRQAAPLNLVILSLGLNDLRWYNAWDAAMGNDKLIQIISSHEELFFEGKPNVLLVSPTLLEEKYTDFMANPDSPCSREETLKFAGYYKTVADFRGIPFFDASTVARAVPLGPGDGAHLGEDGHQALGQALAEEVKKILG